LALTVQELKKLFEGFDTTDLVFQTNPLWGAETTGSKYLLLESLKPFAAFKYSKSHCDDLGGFLALNPASPTGVGLDIEQESRIHLPVVKRVSSQATSDNFKSVWVALEASFKGLRGFKQPQTLSQIQVDQFVKVDSRIETFCLKDPQLYGVKTTRGIVYKSESHFFAFFLSKA
jgi:hypothetical protein